MNHFEIADYASKQIAEARAKLEADFLNAVFKLPADYVPPPPPHWTVRLRRKINQKINAAKTALALKIAPWLEPDDDY